MRHERLLAAVSTGVALAGCAASRPGPTPSPSELVAAQIPPPRPASRIVAAVPILAPWPMILASTPVPNPPERSRPPRGDPAARVARANAGARVQPTAQGYARAAQVYVFDEGALYQVYAAPGQVTDIVLQAGETLSATGPVAAGDTTRWVIGDTESGTGAERRVHILVKPARAKLQTNLVVNTDRRTYHLELRATPATYMPSVGWRYPADEQKAAANAAAARAAEQAAQPTAVIEGLNFAYRVTGARVAWRPVRVFDDGRQTVIEFADRVAQGDLPPLFVGAARGQAGEIVNYRVRGQRMIVDRLFDTAELRLGGGRGQQVVRIVRTAER